MGYLAVSKFAEHQHYKNRRPPWVKFHTKLLDPKHPMNQLPIPTRYLFDRLLLLAANYDNAIPNDFELIARLLRMEPEDCREGLDQLLKGRWIKRTATKRRASKDASGSASKMLAAEAEAEKDTALVVSSNGNLDATPIFNISGERQYEVERILQHALGVDAQSRGVVEHFAGRVPLSVLCDIRERGRGKPIGWVVRALKEEAAA